MFLWVFWKEIEADQAHRLIALFDDRLTRGQYWVLALQLGLESSLIFDARQRDLALRAGIPMA